MTDHSHIYLSRRDLFLTLPFRNQYAPRSVIKEMIDRSRSRWQWFATGQLRNPGLGTLSYLPVELRDLIWIKLDIGGEFRWLRNFIGPFQSPYELRHFNLSAVRRVSHPVKVEFDRAIFATTPIIFFSPTHAMSLLRCIDKWQFSCIRHVSFLLDGSDSVSKWDALFQRSLPPNLQTICLDLYHGHGQSSHDQYKEIFDRVCGTRCKKSLGKTTTGEKRMCSHIHKLNYLSKKLKRDLSVFEYITRMLTRTAPQATIKLAKEIIDCRLCHESCKELLKDVRNP